MGVAASISGGGLVENDGSVSVDLNAVFEVETQAAGEDDFLGVAAESLHIGGGVFVGNANDVLFDDRAVVEVFGRVMSGCADEFHAASISLVIRARSHKRRQETVVNINCLT